MTSRAFVCSCALAASLLLAAPAAAEDPSGGVAAPPAAPSASSSTSAGPAEPGAPAPQIWPAQEEETPTTPEGEEQPPAEQPDGQQAPTEENGGDEVTQVPDTAGEAGGGLPRTGFEVLALTSIGLGLLLAGAALRPTSSWPPPRDRPSRSTARR